MNRSERHAICDDCYAKKRPGYVPLRGGPSWRTCCYCGRENSDSIDFQDSAENTICDSAPDREHGPRVVKESA